MSAVRVPEADSRADQREEMKQLLEEGGLLSLLEDVFDALYVRKDSIDDPRKFFEDFIGIEPVPKEEIEALRRQRDALVEELYTLRKRANSKKEDCGSTSSSSEAGKDVSF